MSTTAGILILAGLFTTRTLVDPAPIPVDSSRNLDQVVAATRDAVSSAGWIAEPIDKRRIRATYRRGAHTVAVLLTLDSKKISLKYESSANLDYAKRGSEAVIHKAYMDWSEALMRSIRAKLSSLCADFTPLLDQQLVGLKYAALIDRAPIAESFQREIEVKTSSGSDTGFVVREYNAYIAGSTEQCSAVSAIYYQDALVSVMGMAAEPAALIAYADMLDFMVAEKQIAFSDAEMERMSLKVDVVTPLDLPRREELLRYVEWQAQRFDRKETTLKEYQYLLAQKEAEVQERQGAIDQKEQELGLLRRQQSMQAQALDVQRQQLAAQRAQNIQQAIANITLATSYKPTRISCQSSAFGNTVLTNCH